MPSGPPVTELAMSVQFNQYALTVLDFASCYELFGDRFPLVQQAPHLAPIQVGPATPVFQFGTGADISFPRLWMISSDQRRLLQFQADRFSFNWRRIEPLTEVCEYPGFVSLAEEFDGYYRELSAWCTSRFHQAPVANVGELLYVNSLPLKIDGTEKRISDVLKCFTPTSRRPIANFTLGWFEMLTPSESGVVTMQAMSVGLPDGTPVIQVTFTGRADLTSRGTEPLHWFDDLHTLTLEMFSSVIKS